MTDHQDVDYTLYRLPAGNPYVGREIDVLRREEDRKYVLPFVGYPADEDLTRNIARAEEDGRPAAFLLSGRGSSGRTTLARAIVRRYQEYRKEHGGLASFSLATYAKPSHDGKARITEILKVIRNEINRHSHWADDPALTRIMPDGEDRTLSTEDLQARAERLVHYAETATQPSLTLGLVVDTVQEESFMEMMAEVFENVRMVIVITRDDYLTVVTPARGELEQRLRWQQWAWHITLPPLTGDCVERLAGNRWNHAAPETDCPFEPDGLRTTFEKRHQPVGLALSWLTWLLERRLSMYKGSEPWPEARELALPAEWIESMVGHFENLPQPLLQRSHHEPLRHAGRR